MLNGFNTRQFGWRERNGSSTTTTLANMPSTTVISFVDGDTYITNNSIEAQTISGPDIYVNNIFEYTSGNGITLHDDTTIGTSVHVPLIQTSELQSIDDVITMDNVVITGNLTVEGTQTALNSVQTNILDHYIVLGAGNTINEARSGGCIINRLPSATSYTLNGNFVAGSGSLNITVGTVESTGLTAGQLVQIAGSTSNDGLYEVHSHAGNVLTLRGQLTSCVDVFCNTQVVAEAAAGTCQIVAVSGIETASDASGLDFIQGSSAPLTRKRIADHLSSPTFTNLACSTLDITTTLEDAALTKVLVVDNTGRVKYRSASSITGGFTPATTDNYLLPITGCGLSGDDLAPIQVRLDPVSAEDVCIEFGGFSITTVSAGAALYLGLGGDSFVSSKRLIHSIWLTVDSLVEECLLIQDVANFRLIICRKNGSNFAAGITVSCAANFPGLGFAVRNYIKFNRF